jgi:serine protease Do
MRHAAGARGARAGFIGLAGAALVASLGLSAGAAVAQDGAIAQPREVPGQSGHRTQRGPESVADLAEALQDAVVNISTAQTLKGPEGVPMPNVPEGSPFEEFFDDFFQPDTQGPPRKVSSLGSGFVIDPSGIIVTNAHVIEGADEVVVNFNDGSKLAVVKVLGRDTKTDLAVLKVEPEKPLKAVSFGDSSVMRVGDWVMAIGNPFGLGGTVTVGIISAKKRDINSGPYDEFLQTDAAINRGNSGGPLFNMFGEVIGINTAIISPTGGSIGIGFAVPATNADQVIDQLKEFGETRRGWLGVHVQALGEDIAESLGVPDAKGALVASVGEGSPAEEAGIAPGDVIVTFAGQPVETMRDLPRLVVRAAIGATVDVELIRKGERRTMPVKVGRLPEAAETQLDAEAEGTGTEERSDTPAQPGAGETLGLSISPLDEKLRAQYGIDAKIDGVVVTDVAADSLAAEKDIKPGDVIVEVTQSKVKTPADVLTRIDAVRDAGRKYVLMLLSDAKGGLRFVAVPVAV